VTDALRWFVMAEGMFILGTVMALFQRAWRFAVPAGATRTLLLAGILLTVAIMTDQYDRLGQPLTWRAPIAAMAMTLYLAGLVRLYVWYRQPEGRKMRHEMIASYLAERMLRAEARKARAKARGSNSTRQNIDSQPPTTRKDDQS
jgi:hypothetical protein